MGGISSPRARTVVKGINLRVGNRESAHRNISLHSTSCLSSPSSTFGSEDSNEKNPLLGDNNEGWRTVFGSTAPKSAILQSIRCQEDINTGYALLTGQQCRICTARRTIMQSMRCKEDNNAE
jgi:hypothetical protein